MKPSQWGQISPSFLVPKRSAAVTAANATASARLSVLDDRASNAVRFPDSVMVAPFSAGSFGGVIVDATRPRVS